MIDPKALEELDLASRAIERARALLAGEGDNATAAAVPFDPWQPISTAPQRRVLLLWALTDTETGNWKMATGSWCPGYADDPGVWEWDGRRLKAYDVQPTHWMELPAPPGAHANQQSKTGVTQASDSLARPSPSPAIRDGHMCFAEEDTLEWLKERDDWDNETGEIVRTILNMLAVRDARWREGIEAAAKAAETRYRQWKMPHPDDAAAGEVHCDVSACEDIAKAIRALHPSVAEGREKNNNVDAAASPIDHNKQE